MSTIASLKCDICGREILPTAEYISASVFGADAHEICFDNLTSRQTCKFLGLDEIEIRRKGCENKRLVYGVAMPPYKQ
jgi:hypothetical protein